MAWWCIQQLHDYFVAIATEMSVWEGVVVTPSDKAYEKQERHEEEEEEDEQEMETEAK